MYKPRLSIMCISHFRAECLRRTIVYSITDKRAQKRCTSFSPSWSVNWNRGSDRSVIRVRFRNRPVPHPASTPLQPLRCMVVMMRMMTQWMRNVNLPNCAIAIDSISLLNHIFTCCHTREFFRCYITFKYSRDNTTQHFCFVYTHNPSFHSGFIFVFCTFEFFIKCFTVALVQ